ncbi:unnamed protein product [Heterobilharzia americana]|nr:unnamed protein product [Heterobilharzia americana]
MFQHCYVAVSLPVTSTVDNPMIDRIFSRVEKAEKYNLLNNVKKSEPKTLVITPVRYGGHRRRHERAMRRMLREQRRLMRKQKKMYRRGYGSIYRYHLFQ